MPVSLIDGLLLNAGLVQRPIVVLDTKALIGSACYCVRTGYPGRLERAIRWPIPVPPSARPPRSWAQPASRP